MKKQEPLLAVTALIIDPPPGEPELEQLQDEIFTRVKEAIEKATEGLHNVSPIGCYSFVRLDPALANCFRCENCGCWATDFQKPEAIQGLPWGMLFEGMMVCDQCRCWKHDPKYGWAKKQDKESDGEQGGAPVR